MSIVFLKRKRINTKMVSNHVVKFLVNKEQFEQLKRYASEKGFRTVSEYMRDVAFNRYFRIEKKIDEIHRRVLKDERRERYERSKESGNRNSRMAQYCF